MISFRFAVWAAAVLGVAAAGCRPASKSAAPAGPPPAKVRTENDLTSITLTPEAERRLGIETAPIERKPVSRRRVLGGELLLPLGRMPEQTNSGPSIYSLFPAMTPLDLVRVAETQVAADGQIKAAQVELESARVTLSRAEILLANKAGAQRAVDDARAQVTLAETALATAKERRALLGAPLFDVVNRAALWVRVPLYAGDLDRIDRTAPATVTVLGGGTNEARLARPVTVPFAGGGLGATVDLYYEMERAGTALQAGQKVSVGVPLQGAQDSLTAPAAAVLYDIHGGTWIYENSAPQSFTRRRVSVRAVQDGVAQLARGPKEGTRVVTAGAAELFGTEFGSGK